LYRNSGASTSWNPKGPRRPVVGKLYLLLQNKTEGFINYVWFQNKFPSFYTFFPCRNPEEMNAFDSHCGEQKATREKGV
jgi:hypothetical protein